MKKYFGFLAIALSVSFASCDKDKIDNGGVTPDGGGETITDVYGCMDENATNFDSSANMDDGSCVFSVAYLASGDWIISNIEYATEVEVPGVGALPVVGSAPDAGTYSLNLEDYSYASNLSFTTEPITVPIIGELPGVPLELPSDGTWTLENNESEISFVDATTGAEQLYTIENLTEVFALLRGSVIIAQDIPGLGVYDFEVELELTLEK